MFGYSIGGADQLRALQIAERETAQKRWPFLTTIDLSGLHNPVQIARMVQDRSSVSKADADAQVEHWLRGYNSRVLPRARLVSGRTGDHLRSVK